MLHLKKTVTLDLYRFKSIIESISLNHTEKSKHPPKTSAVVIRASQHDESRFVAMEKWCCCLASNCIQMRFIPTKQHSKFHVTQLRSLLQLLRFYFDEEVANLAKGVGSIVAMMLRLKILFHEGFKMPFQLKILIER